MAEPRSLLDEAAEEVFRWKGIEATPEAVYRVLCAQARLSKPKKPDPLAYVKIPALPERPATFAIWRALARAAERLGPL